MTKEDILVRFHTEDGISVTVYFREVSEEVPEDELRERALNILAGKGYPKSLEKAVFDVEPY